MAGWLKIYILSHVQRVETGRQVFLVVAIATASRQGRHETGQWDISHMHIHKMRYLSNLKPSASLAGVPQGMEERGGGRKRGREGERSKGK